MIRSTRFVSAACRFALRCAPALALGLCASATLVAQEVPRAADGHPDLNGVWQALNAAHYDIEAHAARAALAFDPGPYGPVPAKEVVALGAVGAVPAGLGVIVGGTIPYQAWALEQRNENRALWLERDPEVRCYLPGIPRANYMPFPFQIFQSADAIFFAYEYAGAARNILLEDPGPAPVDSWMGQSVAHWEGDTLVIEVTAQNDRSWLDRAGNFHSAALTVVERFTPTSPYTMRYEATLDDPEVFTEPWSIALNLYRRIGEDAQLQQFKCIEFVEELMYGHLRKEPLQ
jgi:hypothetical protein